MGFESKQENNTTFLTIAGGLIWNKKADESHPDFQVQEYLTKDNEKKERKGASWQSVTCKVVGVGFNSHDEYGDSIRVSIDVDGESFILSIPDNSRNSQHMMQFLLLGDIKQPVNIRTYDFESNDGTRFYGISFTQNGKKVDLKEIRNLYPDKFKKDKAFFATSTKKVKKRYFEDLNDWLIEEVTNKVCVLFEKEKPSTDGYIDMGVDEEEFSENGVDEKSTKDKLKDLI